MAPDDPEYLQPYREAVQRYGPAFEATLWSSRDAQRLRFDVMIDLADLEGAAVLDVGCGRGDLAARLLERRVGVARYVGVDALAAMIDAARSRDLPGCRFIVADVIARPEVMGESEPDWVCISGTLNTLREPVARSLVSRAFEATRRGVVFNFLSTRFHRKWAAHDLRPARRFDPARWLDFALGLSSRVVFTQRYLDGHDATIVIEADDA